MSAPAAPVPAVPGMTGLTVLARGGYATVYRATQESVGREVAVKVENRTLENDRDQRRFLREARAAGRMSSHPHVVDLFDAGVTEVGHPYLIMELCDGSYAERMKTAPLSPDEARDVGIKIADALADAHSLGVLHRDVKPANILYSRFGEPALADFGLAILTETRDVSITLDVLTPAYAPPEMFRHGPPSPAGDVYALCATLYALMRGKPPRWPDDATPSLVSLVDMFHAPVPDLPGAPPELMRLLREGMHNDEHQRPTAAELRDALQAIGPGAGPTPATPPIQYRPTSSVDENTVPHGIPVARPVERRGLRWTIGGGAAVMAAVVALLVVYAPEDTPKFVEPSGSPDTNVTAVAATCGLILDTDVKCPREPECYDGQVGDDAVPVPRDCNAPHTWEVFAFGELPAGASPSSVRAAASGVCNIGTLTVVGGMDKATWQIRVLPPTQEDLSAGRRTYRCLGGSPPKAFTSPQLTWPPR